MKKDKKAPNPEFLPYICNMDKKIIIIPTYNERENIEKTIRNLGEIGSKGMQATDRMILDIMLCK